MTPRLTQKQVWYLLGGVIAALGLLLCVRLLPVGGASASTTPNDPVAAAVASSDANWAPKPKGMPTIDEASSPGALAFPAGTSYAEATTAIFLAQNGGGVPASARLVPSLPAGAVLLRDGDELTVDLRAPYGWSPQSRLIYTAVIQQSGQLSPTEATEAWGRDRAWPVGGRLGVVDLPACQVIQNRDVVPVDCTKDDVVTIGGLGPILP